MFENEAKMTEMVKKPEGGRNPNEDDDRLSAANRERESLASTCDTSNLNPSEHHIEPLESVF